MAATKAKQDDAVKAPRKKPVRTAPVQKDYPTKLEWLAALVEHETKASEVTINAKLDRLAKRIKSAQATADEATAKVTALKAEHEALIVARDGVGSDSEPEVEQPQA